MKLSVIIPIYNEAEKIEDVITAVAKVNIPKEIIAVDDGSSDQTRHRLEKIKLPELKIISHVINQGKGAAIRTGIKQATGDVILIQDADFEYNPEEYLSLIQPIIDKKTKVVYGSRFKGKIKNMAFPNLVANKVLTLSANLLYRVNITDEATCYKVFDAQLLKRQTLKCNRFDFCPEITAKMAKQGIRIVEVPITYKGRSRRDGKKISWWDGFSALWTLVKYRFVD